MLAIVKSVGATVANDGLPFWAQTSFGYLTDVFAVAFQIYDANGVTVQTRTALDLTANHVGVGHYAATWDSSAAYEGLYTIRWYYQIVSTDTERSFDVVFEVVASAYLSGPHYCALADLAGAPFPIGTKEPAQQKAITVASKYVEHFTGRKFHPEYKTVWLDGTSARAILLDEAICGIESIGVQDPIGGIAIIEGTLLIYNRHVRQNLRSPDDRERPKLEFFHGNDLTGVNEITSVVQRQYLFDLIWPRGRQNVMVTGVFGYTEWDGSAVGKTPDMIREVTRLLVTKLLQIGQGTATGFGGGTIILESTRDQQVQFAQPWLKGWLTGDWMIDSILTEFVRPPQFGAA